MSKSLSHFNEVPDSFELFPPLQLAASSRIRVRIAAAVECPSNQQRRADEGKKKEGEEEAENCQCAMHRDH